MKRVFDFIQSLGFNFTSLLGFPTIKIYSDYVEVYFDCTNCITDLFILKVACDSFRMFPNDGVITIVYTFRLDTDY